ncbi:hypothetical protein XENTR_v10000370 [Xenopus tropicalis]|nr:hypothetical protein XENTR_v10000370 [Xenopus tropicalis]
MCGLNAQLQFTFFSAGNSILCYKARLILLPMNYFDIGNVTSLRHKADIIGGVQALSHKDFLVCPPYCQQRGHKVGCNPMQTPWFPLSMEPHRTVAARRGSCALHTHP